jgi:hypothetical protein
VTECDGATASGMIAKLSHVATAAASTDDARNPYATGVISNSALVYHPAARSTSARLDRQHGIRAINMIGAVIKMTQRLQLRKPIELISQAGMG